jgi:hypothetical protein
MPFLLSTLDSQLRLLLQTIGGNPPPSPEYKHFADLNGASNRESPHFDSRSRGGALVLLNKQYLVARNTLKYLEENMTQQMEEYRKAILISLKREASLKEKVRVLQEEVSHVGLNVYDTSGSSDCCESAEVKTCATTPIDFATFEEDLNQLVFYRDRMLAHIQPLDIISEFNRGS